MRKCRATDTACYCRWQSCSLQVSAVTSSKTLNMCSRLQRVVFQMIVLSLLLLYIIFNIVYFLIICSCYKLNYLPDLTMSVTTFTAEPHVFKRIVYQLCWLGCVTQVLGSIKGNIGHTFSTIRTFKVRSNCAFSGKKITRFLINISGNKITSFSFTFTLPCIVTNFFLNNQQDTLIIQIYCYKTLHISAIFSIHHQEFSTVHSALVSFMQIFDDRLKRSLKTCMKLTSAERTVENSWWWAEKMPEICRVL
jgi:hypothetical protein